MSIRNVWLLLVPVAIGAYACAEWQGGSPSSPSASTALTDSSDAVAAKAATPLSAVIRFGRPDTGSPFPPPDQHDQSGHARDNLTPRDVVIDVGGSVTFEVPADVHQLAIYLPGKEPGDVNLGATVAAPAPCPPVPLINDPVMRLTQQTRQCFQPWTYTQTFSSPGRYLVICTFIPHFEVGMYGWVTVRNRE
jgi:plastocyanin